MDIELYAYVFLLQIDHWHIPRGGTLIYKKARKAFWEISKECLLKSLVTGQN